MRSFCSLTRADWASFVDNILSERLFRLLIRLKALPRCLIITLKRFCYDVDKQRRVKTQQRIGLETSLNVGRQYSCQTVTPSSQPSRQNRGIIIAGADQNPVLGSCIDDQTRMPEPFTSKLGKGKLSD